MLFFIILLTAAMVIDCVILVFLVLMQLPKKEAGIGQAFGADRTAEADGLRAVLRGALHEQRVGLRRAARGPGRPIGKVHPVQLLRSLRSAATEADRASAVAVGPPGGRKWTVRTGREGQ